MNKIIVFFIFSVLCIIKINAQELKLICKVDAANRKYLEYLGEANASPHSFAIDSENIYIKAKGLSNIYNSYIWKYKKKFSNSNPKIIKDFMAFGIKKYGNDLFNIALEYYDLSNGVKISPLADSSTYVYDFVDHIRYTYDDSSIYYFWINKRYYFDFFKYDLNTREIIKYDLDNLKEKIESIYGLIKSIWVKDNNLYVAYAQLTNGGRSTDYFILHWDLSTDKFVKQYIFDDDMINPNILGMDIWNNIYVFGGYSDSFNYMLYILSPKMDLIDSVEVKKLVYNQNFMYDNQFLNSDYSGDCFLTGNINEQNDMFFMVKTIKGLFFLSFEYLELLRSYLGGMTQKELRIFRNTVYAKHGRTFHSKDLQDYFADQYWYTPNPEYSDTLLTDNDRKAITMIQEMEKTASD